MFDKFLPRDTPKAKRARTVELENAKPAPLADASPLSNPLFLKACKTTPPPAARGAIRREFRAKDVVQGVLKKASIMRAKKDNPRTCCRVLVEGRKVSWAELTAKQHPKHELIISRVCDGINDGSIQSKHDAQAFKDKLARELH